MRGMRRFEMREGGSSKFWEIEVEGRELTVKFGKIGTTGQTKTKKFDKPAAAEKEAESLVREKLGKGYVEIGGAKAKAGAAKAPVAKTSAAKAPAVTAQSAKAPPGKPGRFAFTADLDELYGRGWPHLRIVTDEQVTPAKATSEAMKGLTAIDPYFPVKVPREVARRYLRGYVLPKFDAANKALVAKDEGAIDEKWLAEVLERKCAPTGTIDYGGETYDFRLEEIMQLFEAFLGTEVVAKAIAEHLVRARDNVKWWGTWADHHHEEAPRLVEVLGWMRLRMPPKTWSSIVAPLRGSKSAKLSSYCKGLCELADDKVATQNISLLMQRRDAKGVLAALERRRGWCVDPQIVFVAGAAALAKVNTAEYPRLPKWQQLRLIEEMGSIKAAGTLGVIAALLPSRSAGAAAAAWLGEHAADAKTWLGDVDATTANAVRAVLGGKSVAPPAKVDKKALEREVKAIFTGIEAELLAQKGNPKKEYDVLKTAFARYCDLRAALGDVTPEAYFTHHFADVTPNWKVSDAVTQRWLDLAVDAAD
jgi:predicted DNA-binding WGR domain protein